MLQFCSTPIFHPYYSNASDSPYPSQLLASCSLDNTVALFRADSGRLLRQLRVHQDGILAIRFLADDVVVVAGVSGKVHLLQL